MKTLSKIFLVATLTVFQLTTASAANMNPELAKQNVCDKYEIMHINGIMTDFDQARGNLLVLSQKFGNSHNQHIVRYGLAHNATDSFVARPVRNRRSQLMSMYPGSTFREWMNYLTNAVWPNSVAMSALSEVTGTIATFVANVRRPVQYWKTDPDMPRMMGEIAGFHQGGRIVFVGHSQGTIYANIIYNLLTTTGYVQPATPTAPAFKIPAARLGLVAVAAMVTSIPGGNVRITSSNDAAVDAVRKIIPATLGHTHTLTSIDPLGHSFIAHVSGAGGARDRVRDRSEVEHAEAAVQRPLELQHGLADDLGMGKLAEVSTVVTLLGRPHDRRRSDVREVAHYRLRRYHVGPARHHHPHRFVQRDCRTGEQLRRDLRHDAGDESNQPRQRGRRCVGRAEHPRLFVPTRLRRKRIVCVDAVLVPWRDHQTRTGHHR